MAAVGSTPTFLTTSPLPLIPSADPSGSLKRPRPEFSDSEEIHLSKRAKTDGRVVLDENCGSFRPIPDEVVNYILSCCKASALARIGTTCKRLFYLTDRAPMWRELCAIAKLSVKEGDSYRWEFLSAIRRENPDAYRSRACFFTMGKYTQVDHARALACWDHAINMEPFLTKNRAFSESQIDTVFQKGELFFNPFDFDKSTYAPGQIHALYDQLEHIFDTCSSKDKAAKAWLLHTVMQINDSQIMLSYSAFWNVFHDIRHNQQVSDAVRNSAEYLLGLLVHFKPDNKRWNPEDLAQFRQNQGELPDAERGRILKKCLNDNTAPLWMHQVAKVQIADLRLLGTTEEITDKEAYEMLESLKNSTNLIPILYRAVLERIMQQFKDQKRI